MGCTEDPLRRRGHDEGPVAVHNGIELQAASGQECLATAGAVPDDADFAIGIGQRLQMLHRAVHVADQTVVGHASGRPSRGCGIVG